MAPSPPSPEIVSGLVSGSMFSSAVSQTDFFIFMQRIVADRNLAPEESEMIQMMESMTGAVNPKSVTAAQLCKFLKDQGILEVGRCDCEFLNEMAFRRRTWRAILRFEVGFWWRRIRAMFMFRERYMRMSIAANAQIREAIEAELEEEEKAIREDVEASAAARQAPARPTDCEVQVVFQCPESMSTSTFELSISKEDSLDDVYSRAIVNRRHEVSGDKVYTNERDAFRVLEEQKQFRKMYGDPVKMLHKAENQPDWLVVQKGGSTSKKGYVISELGSHVADFDMTPADILHFVSSTMDSVEIFFRTYGRNQAKDAWKKDR